MALQSRKWNKSNAGVYVSIYVILLILTPIVKTGIVNSMVGNTRTIQDSGREVNIEGYDFSVVELKTNFILCKNNSESTLHFCGIYENGDVRREITPVEEQMIKDRSEISGLDTGISVKSDDGAEDVGIVMNGNNEE